MLTIVINSRNDGHGLNQLERLQAFIDGIGDYRASLDWDVEVVLVEWNPPPDRPALPEMVQLDADFVKVYQVPADIHRQFENSNIVPFFFHVAHNTGVRRAAGDWVLVTSQDVLFSERMARWMALENFDKGAYYRAQRFDSNIDALTKGDVRERVALLAENLNRVRPPKPGRIYTKAGGDFVMMHRDHWHALRGGFPEWGLFGVFLDGMVIHSAYTSGLRQVVLPENMVIYHIHHESQGTKIYKSFPHVDYRKWYMPKCKTMMRLMEPLVVNEEDWGLADCEDVKVGEGVWRLAGRERARGVKLPKGVC